MNFVRNRIIHSHLGISPYEAFGESKLKIDWLRTYGSKCWALIPKTTRGKGTYKLADGITVSYFDDLKAYKIWIPHMQTILKVRDVILDEYNHIERVTIHATDDDNLPDLWNNKIPISTSHDVTNTSTGQENDKLAHQHPHMPEATVPAEKNRE